MFSCPLYHGPGARQYALDEASRAGVLLHEPFGEDGLKVDAAHEIVSLLQAAPIGIDMGVVVVGPMDKAPPRSADVLLKSVEEPSDYIWLVLWADDLGGVRDTIQSRCLTMWCPATGFEAPDEELESTARELLAAYLGGRYFEVPGLVAKMKGKEAELLGEVADAMGGTLDNPKVPPLWERVREVAKWWRPLPMEIISAFMPRVS